MSLSQKKLRSLATEYILNKYPSKVATKGLHVRTTSLYAFEDGYIQGMRSRLKTDTRIELEKAYLAGYEKAVTINGQDFDFARELYAKSQFIKWLSGL